MKKSFLVLMIVVATFMVGCPPELTPDPPPSSTYYKLTVSNYSSTTLSQIYISPCSSSSWGADLLSGYIYPGHYLTFTGIRAGCYDLKAVNTDGYCTVAWNVIFNKDITWNIVNAKSGIYELVEGFIPMDGEWEYIFQEDPNNLKSVD